MGDNNRDSRDNGMWNIILIRVSPWVVGLLVGAGGNQFVTTQSLRDKVNSTAQREEHLDSALVADRASRDSAIAAERLAREEQDKATREEMASMRADYVKALDRISTRIDAIIAQNTEVIQLFKVQQQVAKP